ncbi:MAG: cytochrome c3 family protein [Pseudomonadota bacterium]
MISIGSTIRLKWYLTLILFLCCRWVFSADDLCQNIDCLKFIKPSISYHTPVQKFQCLSCHQKTTEAGKWEMNQQYVQKGCLLCHKQQLSALHGKNTPLLCSQCHDPHGSYSKDLLLKNYGTTCRACHQATTLAGKNLHPPAKNGDCQACHTFHRPAGTAKLKDQKIPSGFCLTCHTEMESRAGKAKSLHKPVLESCQHCHSAHASNNQALLLLNAPELCQSCHQKHFDMIHTSKVSHGALGKKQGCLNCHQAHYSNNPKLLAKPTQELCFDCHNKELISTDGRKITNMKKLITTSRYLHGPVRLNACYSCHDVHGGNNKNLLKGEYPDDLYSPYSRQTYSLCFTCHPAEGFESIKNFKNTNFHNDLKNLHFVHVSDPKKGRSCRNCHSVHASNQPFHMAEAVSYGTLSMNLFFTKTAEGGTCAAACHAQRSYQNSGRANIQVKFNQIQDDKK